MYTPTSSTKSFSEILDLDATGLRPDQLEIKIVVEYLGGIEETELLVKPGVTVLEGQNATNRTSFLRALAFGLGGNPEGLSVNANTPKDGGRVTIEVYESGKEEPITSIRRTYLRDFAREDDGLYEEGQIIDDFVALLELNKARGAVERDDPEALLDLLMRPYETNEDEIEALQAEIAELDEKVSEAEQQKEKLREIINEQTRLEERQTELTHDIEHKEDEYNQIQSELNELGGRESEDEIDKELANLQSARNEIDEKLVQKQRRKESIDNEIGAVKREIKEKKKDAAAVYEEITGEEINAPESVESDVIIAALESDGAISGLDSRGFESRINKLEEDQSQLQRDIDIIDDLSRIIRRYRTTAESDRRLLSAMADKEETDEETDQVEHITDAFSKENRDESLVCPMCRNRTDSEQLEEQFQYLQQELRNEIAEERQAIQTELETVRERLENVEELRTRAVTLRNELKDLTTELNRFRKQQSELTETIEDIETEIEAVTDEIESLRSKKDEHEQALLERRDAIQQDLRVLERELGTIDKEIKRVSGNRQQIESQVEIDELREKKENRRKELEELRGQRVKTERHVVETFNEKMEEIISLLEYENIGSVRLERVTDPETGEAVAFRPQIVRVTDSGGMATSVKEFTTTFSESEREIVGLVVALAGYFAHNLNEHIPFLLLDSLEAIDATRLARLIKHLEDKTVFLIIALLPEDANKIDFDNEQYRNVSAEII